MAQTPEAPELTYEQALARLEQIVKELEAGERSLEEALTLFQDGVGMAKLCAARLDAAANRLEQVLADGSVAPLQLPEGGQ